MISKILNQLKPPAFGNGGFTLLETMVAMLIFAVAMTAVLYMEVVGISDHRRSRDNVSNIHGNILQSEVIAHAVPYSHDLLAHDDSNGTDTNPDPHNSSDLPVDGYQHASYSVKGGTLVRGIKMVYMSNKVKADGHEYTLGIAVPNTEDVEDTDYQ